MYRRASSKWVAITLGAGLIALLVPARGTPGGKCDCSDIPAIEDRMRQVRKALDAWQKVQGEIEAGRAMTEADALARLDELLGHPKGLKKVCWVDDTGPHVDPDFARNNCEDVVKACKQHELEHLAHHGSLPWQALDRASGLGVTWEDSFEELWGRFLAASEVYSYITEGMFLQMDANQLKNRCGGQIYSPFKQEERDEAQKRLEDARRRLEDFSKKIP